MNLHRLLCRFGTTFLLLIAASQNLPAQAVPPPSFEPDAGTFSTAIQVRITSGTPGATIRYTLDGTDPEADDPVYSAPVYVGRTLTLKARAWDASGPGTVHSAQFTITGWIAAGENHAMALRFDGGRLVAWGDDSFGQVGDGSDNGLKTTPVTVLSGSGALFNLTEIDAGTGHSVAVKADGSVWSWGRGMQGQLGNGSFLNRDLPVQVQTTARDNPALGAIVAIAAGGRHNLALDEVGAVWAWGRNVSGQLGDGGSANRAAASKVRLDSSTKVAGADAIAAGANHSLLLEAGVVYAWGDNSHQQATGSAPSLAYATAVSGLSGVVAIEAGANHSLAVTADGTLYAWGLNDEGQCGSSSPTVAGPAPVPGATNVAAVAAGASHTLVLENDGSLWAMGLNEHGQLGTGGSSGATLARVKSGPETYLENVVGIAAGANASFALTTDGRVYAWGSNAVGQLGNGAADSSPHAYATPVPGLQVTNRAPTLTLQANPPTAPELATITLKAKVTDPDSNVSRVDFFDAKDGLLGSDSTAPFTWSVANLPASAEPYLFHAEATDAAGETGPRGSTSATVTTQSLHASALLSVIDEVESGWIQAFRVSRAAGHPANKPITFNYILAGSATAGADYECVGGRPRFWKGARESIYRLQSGPTGSRRGRKRSS